MHLEAAATSAVKAGPTLVAFPPGLAVGPAVAQIATPMPHRKAAGEILFSEGEDAESVYEVTGGMLRLYKLLPDGRRQITGFATAGHLLGLAPEGICVYTAEALTEVTLRRYKRAAVRP